MLPSSVYHIAPLCHSYGLRDVVVSPGSRSAALVLAFTRHKGFRVLFVPDERSAGFMALGLSLVSGLPTVLVCTSGTAPLHYAPALAEARAQHVPLLVLSANRPPEWIDQQDGQTLPAYSWYGALVKQACTFPDTYAHDTYAHKDIRWHAERLVQDALSLCTYPPAGPVHIDIPLREPFYPHKTQSLVHQRPSRVLHPIPTSTRLTDAGWKTVEALFAQHPKVLILAGQEAYDKNIQRRFEDFYACLPVPLLGDVLSNLHGLPMALRHADLFLKKASASLRPDMLITFGKSVLSKHLKHFLRSYPPKAHIRLHHAGVPAPDTFQHLTHVIHLTPSEFFLGCKEQLSLRASRTHKAFLKRWERVHAEAAQKLQAAWSKQPFSAFRVLHQVMHELPGYCYLHLANSMCVRYAQWIGLGVEQKAIEVFANRGTSGIDGCLSTAVGAAIQSEYTPNVLIIGDVAFFHDRNALWHRHVPANLKIVLLNDHGGGIFRHLQGVAALPECETYFVGAQDLSARHAAEEYKLAYFHADGMDTLQTALQAFFRPMPKAALLEIETHGPKDAVIFQDIMQSL